MKKFLGAVVRQVISIWLALIIVFGVVVGLLASFFVTLAYESHREVKDNSVLVIDLGEGFRDSPDEHSPRDWVWSLMGEERKSENYLLELLRVINEAKDDDRIRGIVLKGKIPGDHPSMGFAQISEMREALTVFSESKKPMVAFLEAPGVKELYLASVANQVIMDPLGEILFHGIGIEQPYFGEALKKYGIGVQVTKVGKYKTGVEPFTRKNMSNEEREQAQELLDDIWNKVIVEIGKSRSINIKKLNSISNDHGVLLSLDAKNYGLIDEVGYYENSFKLFKDGENDKINKVSVSDYVASLSSKTVEKASKIGVFYVEGAMVDGEGHAHEAGAERLVKKLDKLRKNEDVKAIVVRVNSPGGAATAAEKIQRAIRLTMEKKPVVISMGDYAASGGYWISAYADKVYADALTVTGSIGVYGALFNVQDIAKNYGVNFDYVSTGVLGNLESIGKPKSEKEMKVLQRMTDFIYGNFIQKVSEGRKLDQSYVESIAGGRVWSGEKALKKQLVDDIGGLNAAIEHAATLAKLESGTWEVKQVPEAGDFVWEWVGNWMEPQDYGKAGVLGAAFQKLSVELRQILHMKDSRGVYAYCPYAVN